MNDFESKVSRLIAAAVVNQRFRQTLLTNLAKAIEGYGNKRFHFTPTERELILLIHATTLQEFADQVQQLMGKTQVSESTIE